MNVASKQCLDCRRNPKELDAVRWFTDRQGYIRGSYRGRTVMQHRVLFEQELGRDLLDDESVHHKNGIKHDNRLSNLELWSRYQPNGQRVKDKLEYAYEIIKRYGPSAG